MELESENTSPALLEAAPNAVTDVAVDPLSAAVFRLSKSISKEVIGNGGIAELKRSFNKEMPAPVFWRLLVSDVEGAGVSIPHGSEKDWTMILGGMATMAPNHQANVSLGRALFFAEYPEARLRRLLSTEPGTEMFTNELFAAVKWLDKQAQAVNWADIAYLIVDKSNPERLEKRRRRVARDFYTGIKQ